MKGTGTFSVLIASEGPVAAQRIIVASVFLANGNNVDLIEVVAAHPHSPESATDEEAAGTHICFT